MASTSFIIPGTVGLKVTLTEQLDGTVRFDLENQGNLVGDLRGLFFDVNDSGLLSNLSVVGADVTGSSFTDNDVVNLGGGVNMNGVGNFDAGILFGTAGISKDDINVTSFVLKSASGGLNLAHLSGVDFGVRFTSVGEADGARTDSLKIFSEAPDFGGVLPPPPPPFEIDPLWPVAG